MIMITINFLRVNSRDSFLQTDKVFLEDESGRIELISDNEDVLRHLVTGVTIAVLGLANENGQFQVGVRVSWAMRCVVLFGKKNIQGPKL